MDHKLCIFRATGKIYVQYCKYACLRIRHSYVVTACISNPNTSIREIREAYRECRVESLHTFHKERQNNKTWEIERESEYEQDSEVELNEQRAHSPGRPGLQLYSFCLRFSTSTFDSDSEPELLVPVQFCAQPLNTILLAPLQHHSLYLVTTCI